MPAKYVVKTGETLNLQLTVVSGSLSSVSAVTAVLKKATGNGNVPLSDVPKIADFVVSTITNGWNFRLPSATSAILTPGMYVTDAKITLNTGEVMITEPVQIEIRSSVS